MAAAHATRGPYHPRDGSLARQIQLPGLVICASCSRRLQVGGYGKKGHRKAHSFCNAPKGKCPARANVSAARLDAYVEYLLIQAAVSQEPHIAAVIEDDTRYQDALAEVEAARRDLEEYRDDLELQRELGTKSWAEGLKPRKKALRLAQKQLARIPHPATASGKDDATRRVTYEAFLAEYEREANRHFIDRVEVKPVGRGRRSDIADRVDVYFVGSVEPYRPTYAKVSKRDQEIIDRHMAEVAARQDATG